MSFKLIAVQSTMILLRLIHRVDGVNSASIKAATEYHLGLMRHQVEYNYQHVVEANIQYPGCNVYDLCQDPPTLHNGNVQIDDWSTSGTPWHNPQCSENETLIGVKPNNHNPQNGSVLTSETCPQSNPYIACNYDNSHGGAGITIPFDVDTNSQEFLDATCFAHELEQISSTRTYSNCHTDEECNVYQFNNETEPDMEEIYCQENGICSNTDTPNLRSFESQYVEYQYYGDQRTGTFLNIPAMYWDSLDSGDCPGTYDPRRRPWYAVSASGPKDVILILDTSGSMAQITQDGTSRLDAMKSAAKSVLDTLYKYDYTTLIDFDSEANNYSSTLVPVTDENRCKLENYIDSLTSFGNTNYESAFEKAFDIMTESKLAGNVSDCSTQAILFLTDGEITAGREDIVDYIEELKEAADEGISLNILTYGIGEDLKSDDLEKLQDIACNNNGIAYAIENIDDSLSTTMASYYEMFSLSRQIKNDNDTWTLWIDQYDFFTDYLLFSACVTVYDKTTDPFGLLGVVCADVAAERLIDSNKSTWGNSVGIYDDWDDVYDEMQNTAKLCPILNFDYDQLEVIRKSSHNAKSCENTPNTKSTPSVIEVTAAMIVGIVVTLIFIVFVCLYQFRKYKSRQKERQINVVVNRRND